MKLTHASPGLGGEQSANLPTYNVAEKIAWSYADLANEPLLFFLKPYRSHGPIFRITLDGVETLVMAGPEANELAAQPALWSYNRAHEFLGRVTKYSLGLLDGEEHSAKRRRITPLFRRGLLNHHADQMLAELRKLLSDNVDRVVDLRDLANLSFFRQSCAVLGLQLGEHAFADVLLTEKLLLEGGVRGDRDGTMARECREAFSRIRAAIKPVVEARLAYPDGQDMISVMIRSHDPAAEPSFDIDELVDDVVILLVAGVENGAHVILWTLLYLDQNQRWRSEVFEEVCSAQPDRLTDPIAMPKLNASILEAERLRPPFPVVLKMSNTDFELGGYRVASQTRLLHPMTLVHFLDEIYPDALVFRPERHFQASHSAKLHSAFGIGVHRCIGMPLAREQAMRTVAELLNNWIIQLEFTPSLNYIMKDNVTPIESSLPARISPVGRRFG